MGPNGRLDQLWKLPGLLWLTMEEATLTGSARSLKKEWLDSLKNAFSRLPWTSRATCSGFSMVVDSRIEFKASRTKEGTFPEGSHWTRDPIPNCLYTQDPGPNGAYGLWDVNCTHGTQFTAPGPGLFGYGQNPPPYYDPTFAFSIVDHLAVPDD